MNDTHHDGVAASVSQPDEQTARTLVTSSGPKPWHFSAGGIAFRLFLTCWLVYVLHFATDIVREIYPALALGDHLSFRVDEYANMHPDLFEKEGYGWHIGNNPGGSMVAAIPYAMARPIIDPIVRAVNERRAASGLTEPPTYDSPWPMQREFYAKAWRRGYDIKFGLAAFVMQAFAMAPISAAGVVVMFYVLRRLFGSDKIGLGLALLYAFGTPVFFRTGFLNHNLMLGVFAFTGFVLVWNPYGSDRFSTRQRALLCGLAGGAALLFDYSGLILLIGLFGYTILKRLSVSSWEDAFRHGLWYILGTVGPVALLWFYQWQSFGNPFLPGQHWMPPVEWIELGYQGYGLPQLELLVMLAFDYRFGFFVTSPLMLLAWAAPIVDRGERRVLPKFELAFILALFIAFWVFFSGSNYTRLQYNTGIRYMIPMMPFMFLPAAVVLMRLPRLVIYFIAVLSITESWSQAMYREVEFGPGMLEPMLRIFFGGFQLPALRTLSLMGDQYGDYFANGASPLPLFVLTAAILYGIWSPRWSTWKRAGSSVGNRRAAG